VWYITLTCRQDGFLQNFELIQRVSGQATEASHPNWHRLFAKFNDYLQLDEEAADSLRKTNSIFFIPLVPGSDACLLMVLRSRVRASEVVPATISFFDPSLSRAIDHLWAIIGSKAMKGAVGRVNVRCFSDKRELLDDLDIRGELTGFWIEFWRRIKSESFVNILLTLLSTLLTLLVLIRLGMALVMPVTALDGLSLFAPLISTGVLLAYYALTSIITVKRCHGLRFLFTAGRRMFFHMEKWEP
jgi:hypothetical protein